MINGYCFLQLKKNEFATMLLEESKDDFPDWHCQALSALSGFIGITKLYRHYQALLTSPSFIDITRLYWHYQGLLALPEFIDISWLYWHHQTLLKLLDFNIRFSIYPLCF